MARFLSREWTRQELAQYVGHMDQIAGVRLMEGTDGTAKNARIFNVYTGTGLSFDVLADRALDISSCKWNGLSLAWNSSSGDVHPAYYEPEGLGWLRSFQGGLVATCGMDYYGAPGSDAGEDFGLHGRVGNLPAHQVNYGAFWYEDEYYIEINGKVRQTRLFGENLLLERRIATRLGSNSILLEDKVTNEGFSPQPLMMLYHCNLGFPLIGPDTELHVNAESTRPRDAVAEPGLSQWNRFQGPTAGYKEQVFLHSPAVDSDGKVTIDIKNPKLDFFLRMSYLKEQLPHLVEWKMMGQGAYVLGVEPGNTGSITGRANARAAGDLPMLEPMSSQTFAIEFEVIAS